jgi:hypothetical protein
LLRYTISHCFHSYTECGGDERKVGGLNAWDPKHVAKFLAPLYPSHFDLRDRFCPIRLLPGLVPHFSRSSRRVSAPFNEKLQLGQSSSGTRLLLRALQAFIGFTYCTWHQYGTRWLASLSATNSRHPFCRSTQHQHKLKTVL